jgi:hypothetical protein
LPQFVVIDLGHRGAEPVLQLGLGGFHVLSLALEGAGLREVEVDREDRDETGGQEAEEAAGDGVASSSDVRSTSRVS